MIDHTTVTKIKEAARIEDVVSDFVTLRRSGINLKGLCPFHDDRTPSFIVSPVRNTCKCFACGEGGGPVTFIMKHEQCDYPEALRYLARKYGIPIQEREQTADERQRGDDRESMFILNEWAAGWFRSQLTQGQEGQAIGMSYLRSRGFRDDILERFQLGYCPAEGSAMAAAAKAAGYQEQYLVNTPDERDVSSSVGTGLCTVSQRDGSLRDRFRGRVIWPIYTASGRVAGFGGRVLDAATKGVNVKYLNSPESVVYSKRRELFGLHQARKAIAREGCCYLVEGYTDVMGMHQSGVENVVATSGTALTAEQIRLIHRLCTTVVMVFDGDAAGAKASKRGIDMFLRAGMSVRVLPLPPDEDPDSLSHRLSPEEFQTYLKDNQKDFISYAANQLSGQAAGDPMALSQLTAQIVGYVAVIPDPIARTFYIKETARVMDVQESVIAEAVARSQTAQRADEQKVRRPQTVTEAQPTTPATATAHSPRLVQIERELIRAVTMHGHVRLGDDGPRVVEYIDQALRQDQVELTTPLYRQILAEALSIDAPEDFDTERHFVNHQDPAISQIAFEFSTGHQQLSRIYSKDEESTTDHMTDVVPHLLADYKLLMVQEQLRAVGREVADPAVASDMERYAEVMRRFMSLKEVERKLSQIRGDRVIR